MLELGDASREKHFELGKFSFEGKVSKLFITGQFANDTAEGAIKSGMNKSDITVFNTNDDLKKSLLNEIKTGDVILIKGSRGMKMEEVSDYLRNTIGV
jgi:UDP-N-acetylmuramoyl-tripeptide--D-alanyl-D-alanine ligase